MIRVGDDACEDMRSGMSPLAVMGEIESGADTPRKVRRSLSRRRAGAYALTRKV